MSTRSRTVRTRKAAGVKQTSIPAYTKISKPVLPTNLGDKGLELRKPGRLSSETTTQTTSTPSITQKRKRSSDNDDSDGRDSAEATCTPTKRLRQASVEQTTENTDTCYDLAAAQLPSPARTPTKRAKSPKNGPAPTLSKGQQRLTDLKGLAIQAQKESHAITHLPSPSPSPTANRKRDALQSRSNSLLSRLKAKQAEQANAPPPLSSEDLARKTALQRLPDVAAVLSLPRSESVGAAREAHGLSKIIQRIQNSSRSPLGRAEVERCLRLLSDEAVQLGAAGFVRLVKMGDSEAVVVDPRCRPADLQKTVATLLVDM